jgi:hypothetical protein
MTTLEKLESVYATLEACVKLLRDTNYAIETEAAEELLNTLDLAATREAA